MKKCSKCKIEKDLNDFPKTKRTSDGYASWCKKCNADYHRKYYWDNYEEIVAKRKPYKKTKEQHKRSNLKQSFGITLEEYNAMREPTKDICYFCGKLELKKFCLDHDHNNGRLRGFLCNRCNIMIAWFEKYREEVLEYLDSEVDLRDLLS